MATRDEKKAATRKKLLDAAAALVAKQGAMSASLDAIAAKAGLTKGAVYSNFSSKEDLLFALAEAVNLPTIDFEDFVDESLSVADNLERLGEELARQLSTVTQRAWQLGMEIMHYAQRNPRARRVLAAEKREGVKQGAAIFDRLRAASGETPILASDELDVVVDALALGLAQKRAIDPASVPDELFPKAFRLLAG